MVSISSDQPKTSSTLDPHLFPFKPKLNEKSSQIAQNLLSDFYERQLKHVQRLQALQEEAAIDYRQWYCHLKPPTLLQPLPQIHETLKSNTADAETSQENRSNDTSTSSLASAKEARQSNVLPSRSNRAHRSPPLTSKATRSTVAAPVAASSAPPTATALRSQPAPLPPVTVTASRTQPPPPPVSVSAQPSVHLAPVSTTQPGARRKSHYMSPSNRSKSPPKMVRQPDPSPKRTITNDSINTERLKQARDEAERAMKEHKIFTIIGPYPALRESLRRRGWVEKFYRGNALPSVHGKKSEKKTSKSDDDDDENDDDVGDDDLDEQPTYEDDGKVPPWEENDGYYGLLSRLVRAAPPNLIWSVRASYDSNSLSKDQMVNHYSRNGCFTTKTGLCNSLRSLPWFHSGSSEEFFPRCYKLSHEDDKVAFIDDYHLTSCMNLLKLVQNRCKGVAEPDMNSILAMSSDSPGDAHGVSNVQEEEPALTRSLTMLPGQLGGKTTQGKTSSKKVPSSAIEFALKKANEYILSRDHEDIDMALETQVETTDEQWTQFIEQFYLASHSNVEIEGMEMYISKIDECLKTVQQHWPQYHIDGTRNIWILKPGAKSRGRGIVVYDRLEDILKLCSSTLTKDGKFVVQKYIERPLLIHNTKFDIRQWFLVTDWNPLTIWMFKDCYLRFCTEHFSLETRQQNVHLCNYSIQKHYKNNAKRHPDLPVENMWTNAEFIEKYLRPLRLADRWEKFIYPSMKDAIICSMLVAQDTIDTRKNSFELFGADFMLGEDLKPWLIEINCSPTMARSTAVTTDMCDGVLEDTCKVMIDRKYNRTADTGRFELIHRGATVTVPNYLGIDLRLEGKPCKTGRVSNNCSSSNIGNPNITMSSSTLITSTVTQSNTTSNTNPVVLTPVSIPATARAPSPHSSHSTTPAEPPPIVPHPSSALSAQYHATVTKTSNSPASLKLRREMTQPALSRIELFSSTDLPMEKLAVNDFVTTPYRASLKINGCQPPIDVRSKLQKSNSTRLSAEYLPQRQTTRSKIVTDRLPSPKGNSSKNTRVSKINALDFLFTGKDVKPCNPYSFFRPYQRSWVFCKTQQPARTSLTPLTLPKFLKKRNNNSPTPEQVQESSLSMASTMDTVSTLDANAEPVAATTASPSSALLTVA